MNVKVHKKFVRAAVWLCKESAHLHSFGDDIIECNLREAEDDVVRAYAEHYLKLARLISKGLAREFVSSQNDEAFEMLQRFEKLTRGYRAGNVPHKP